MTPQVLLDWLGRGLNGRIVCEGRPWKTDEFQRNG